MKSFSAVLVLILLAGCAGAPDTRSCLVSLDGGCLAYDFGSSLASAPRASTICP
jgi:hypothetical protein